MELSDSDDKLILNIMKYWVDNWDFECPTLFGIELEDLQNVIDKWPEALLSNSVHAGRAVSASFGELLWGASSLSDARVKSEFGKSKDDLEAFYKSIHEEIKVMRDE